MNKLARRVAARWAFQVAMAGPNPPIPSWVFEQCADKVALAPSPRDIELFDQAKESIHLMLPSLLALLKKRLGDRYSMNASRKGLMTFFYFSSIHPIDSVVLVLKVQVGHVYIEMSYVPYKLSTNLPDYTKAIEVRDVVKDAELAGLSVMRLARNLLDKVA